MVANKSKYTIHDKCIAAALILKRKICGITNFNLWILNGMMNYRSVDALRWINILCSPDFVDPNIRHSYTKRKNGIIKNIVSLQILNISAWNGWNTKIKQFHTFRWKLGYFFRMYGWVLPKNFFVRQETLRKQNNININLQIKLMWAFCIKNWFHIY